VLVFVARRFGNLGISVPLVTKQELHNIIIHRHRIISEGALQTLHVR
jgi:hypothetical protein